jgi:hypothetical protein
MVNDEEKEGFVEDMIESYYTNVSSLRRCCRVVGL